MVYRGSLTLGLLPVIFVFATATTLSQTNGDVAPAEQANYNSRNATLCDWLREQNKMSKETGLV